MKLGVLMKHIIQAACATAILTAAGCLTATAADLGTPVKQVALPVIVEPFDPFQIRIRALGVLPDGKISSNYGGLVTTKVNNTAVPEVDVSYYFTRNWAVELIAAVTPHDIRLKNAIPALGLPANYKVANSLLLPPTLTLQYHFTNFGAFQPYAGIGINYTFFLDTKQKGVFNAAHLSNSPGLALQAGFDYMINRNWGINVDFKKVFLDPGIRVNSVALPAGPISGHIKMDPYIIGAGITYRFGG